MKIELEKIISSVEPLKRLFSEPLPIKTTFRLKKITQEIEDNLRVYDESRNTLLKKYGKAGDDGTYKIPEDKQETVEKEHKELLSMKVSLSFSPIQSSLFGDISISPSDLLSLDWLIVE